MLRLLLDLIHLRVGEEVVFAMKLDQGGEGAWQ